LLTTLHHTPELIAAGELDRAQAVFQLNALAFPEHWNTHDSPGEALARRGDFAAAIASYSRSVALSPENRNGVPALELLQQRSMPALSGWRRRTSAARHLLHRDGAITERPAGLLVKAGPGPPSARKMLARSGICS
jgi:tetratricopeptide (TPR) repeat protein